MNDKSITLDPRILRALDLEPDNDGTVSRGNVAAHAYRETFATSADPFAGINLGWVDKDASTDFLVTVVLTAEEALDNDDEFDADSCVPIYTQQLLTAAIELGATSVEDSGLLPADDEISMERIAQIALYELAEQIGNHIMRSAAGLRCRPE